MTDRRQRSLADDSEATSIFGLIEACQANLDLDELRIDLFNYWPLLVFEIIAQKKFGPRSRSDRLTSTAKSLIQSIHGSSRFSTKISKDFDIGECDTLFFSRPVQFMEYESGMVAHPSCDGINLALGHQSRTIHTIFGDMPARRNRTHFPIVHIPRRVFGQSISLVLPKSGLERQLKRSVLQTIEAINNTSRGHLVEVKLDGATILNSIENIHSKALYFVDLLQRVRPKIIFLSSFTGSLYVCVAANKLGIPVVDIQHGGMSAEHFLACDWRLSNGAHHELLPNVFWCWDQRSQNIIANTKDASFKTVIGGNPKTFFELEVFRQSQGSKIQKGARPTILLALSYGQGELFPQWLLRLFKETENIWSWEFRLHPRGLNRLNEVANLTGYSKQTLVRVAKEPVSIAWARVDVLITKASSLAYDAIEKSIPVAVWSDQGAGRFKDLVASNQLTVTTDYQNMLSFLKRNTTAYQNSSFEIDQEKRALLLAEQIRSTYFDLIDEASNRRSSTGDRPISAIEKHGEAAIEHE